jgi:hypothetical protein
MTIITPEKTLWIAAQRRAGRTNMQIAEELGVDVRSIYAAMSRSGRRPQKSSSIRGIEIPIQQALVDFARQTVKPLPAPRRHKRRAGKFAVAWGLWDLHIGSYAWQAEVGADWDTSIAMHRVFNSVDTIIEELRPYKIDRIWMPVGNDFLAFDSVRMTTALGLHTLDVDTRYARVYQAALRCLVYMIDRALEICDRVEPIYIPGNHDTTASYTLVVALQERYRNNPRVMVDAGPNPRKHRLYGGSLVGFAHGHNLKIANLVTALATEARDVWSKTTYREIQVGHKHARWEQQYEGVIAGNGILVRRNPSLGNCDAWTYNQALLGEPMKSVEAWRYDAIGYRGSHVAWAVDAVHKKVRIDG